MSKQSSGDAPVQVGRLALRIEGDWWHAYYAKADTMADAISLGTIRMTIVDDLKHKAAFLALMREVVGDILEEATGTRPTWGGEELAPEHEKASRA